MVVKYSIGVLGLFACACCFIGVSAQPRYDYEHMQRENLGRGVVAVPTENGDSAIVSWRYLDEDAITTGFNVYRNGRLLNKKPIVGATFLKDVRGEDEEVTYEVRTVDGKKESHRKDGSYTLGAAAGRGYLSIALDVPEGGTTPDGRGYRYSANDCSVGDVDGDGEYEIILKWDPSNAHDNAHDGYTGNVLFDCYTLGGKRLWRIDLGRNIRAGAHYTQFMVYDLDGDGKAEVMMKTSDGTVDGRGKVIGDASADYRARNGRILTGNEYFTVFNGETGEAMCTVDYVPERGILRDWGDENANRSDRYLACLAYLDGVHPSVVMCRGYYTRAVLAAWDWDGKNLKQHWVFDSDKEPGHNGTGQGNHNIRVADVDGDGMDEILYGAMCVDHDGKVLYNTRLGHGDAMHLMAFFPDSEKLQLWNVHEGHPCSELHDAADGKIYFSLPASEDVGRGMAADIDPTNWGLEMWSSASGGIRNVKGELTEHQGRVSVNSAVWWDGDLLRELLDGGRVSKFNWKTGRTDVMLDMNAASCTFNNGTKSNPCLSADIFGDWREEVIVRTRANDELRIYTTTIPTEYRFHTFMQDIPYRLSVATENVAYNQPPEPGFYFGSDMKKGRVVRGWKF